MYPASSFLMLHDLLDRDVEVSTYHDGNLYQTTVSWDGMVGIAMSARVYHEAVQNHREVVRYTTVVQP